MRSGDRRLVSSSFCSACLVSHGRVVVVVSCLSSSTAPGLFLFVGAWIHLVTAPTRRKRSGTSVRLGHKSLRTLMKRSSSWYLPGVLFIKFSCLGSCVSWKVRKRRGNGICNPAIFSPWPFPLFFGDVKIFGNQANKVRKEDCMLGYPKIPAPVRRHETVNRGPGNWRQQDHESVSRRQFHDWLAEPEKPR